jgi:Tol biopolymer transport system component
MSIARSLVSIIAGLGVVMGAASCRDTPPPVAAPIRLTLEQPAELVVGAGHDFPFGLALAPDGRRVVFPASRARPGQLATAASPDSPPPESAEDGWQLWLRDLSTDTVTPLAGTDGGVLPFWSSDGQTIGFFAAGKMRALAMSDGTIRDLAEAPSPRGAAWHASGEIVFAPRPDAGLMRWTPDGAVQPLTTLDGDSSHRLPQFVDNDHLVFFVRATEPTRQGIWITRRDNAASRRRLASSDAAGVAVNGALVYASGEALVGQIVNLDTLSLTGRPQLIGPVVGRGPEHQLFATSAADVLLFGQPTSTLRELRLIDPRGATLGRIGEPMNAWDVRLSPVGAFVAVARVDPQLNTLDIWAYDDQRPLPRRISPAIDADDSPAWSRDAARIAWVTGRRTVTMRDSRAERPEVTLRKFDNVVRVTDWSPDGAWIVLSESRSGTGADIVLLGSKPNAESRVYAEGPFNQTHGAVSPDGRWLAYASDESGTTEIYIDAFPAPGRRARLSVGGGSEPRWARDGTTVYFRRRGEVHRVVLSFAGVVPEARSSERLFDAGAEIRAFDATPDGSRFLVNLPAPDATPRPMSVLIDWSPRPDPDS